MPEDFKSKARECLEKADYLGYAEFAKRQYEFTKDEEDMEEMERAKKMVAVATEIKDILKLEGENSYRILGVSENASQNEIKKSFKEKAGRYHPNRARVKGSEDAFRIIQAAYFEINTEEKRAQYDSRRSGGGFFFGNQPYSRPFQSQVYTSRAQPGSFAFAFANSAVGFTGTNPEWPFRFNDILFESIYTNLYRNARAQRRTSQGGERPAVFVSIIVIIVLILINILG